MLTGACEAGFYRGVICYLSTWLPAEMRGRAFAWFIVSIALIEMNACRPAFFSMLPPFVQGAAAAGAITLINSVGNL